MGISKLKIPKICEQCGKPFEAKTVVTRFCSSTCINKFGKEKKKQAKEAEYKQIPVEAIKNLTDESAINIVANTFNSHDTSTQTAVNYYPTFNPVDKLVEVYERMLKAEQEKVRLLQEALRDKK